MERRVSEQKNHWVFPTKLPYKHAVRCGNLIFVGGQVPFDKNGKLLFPHNIVEQTRLVMEYMKDILADVGATLDDVVKVNRFYVSSGAQEEWALSAKVCAEYFNTNPALVATGIPVPALAIEGLMIEIEAIAVVKD